MKKRNKTILNADSAVHFSFANCICNTKQQLDLFLGEHTMSNSLIYRTHLHSQWQPLYRQGQRYLKLMQILLIHLHTIVKEQQRKKKNVSVKQTQKQKNIIYSPPLVAAKLLRVLPAEIIQIVRTAQQQAYTRMHTRYNRISYSYMLLYV